MNRFATWFAAVLAFLLLLDPAHGVLVMSGRYRVLVDGFETGAPQQPPVGWTTGGRSMQLIVEPGEGAPAAPEGRRYLQMSNNPVPTGFAYRRFAAMRRGNLRCSWRMYIVEAGAEQAGGAFYLRTSGPAEGRAAVSWNRATPGQASYAHAGSWRDAGVPFKVGRWQTWTIDYNFNDSGSADDTYTLTVDGATSTAITAGTNGPDDIGELLIEQSGALHDFYVDMPEPPPIVAPSKPSRPKHFGRQWVRRNPFTIMGLTALRKEFDAEQYRRGGFGAALAFKNKTHVFEALTKARIDYHYRVQPLHKGPLTEEVKAQVAQVIEHYPGATGIFMYDEPKWMHMPDVAKGNEWVRETWPHLLTYTNANPIGGNAVKYYGKEPPGGTYTYQQYIADIVDLTRSDVLCFDIYPFAKGPVAGHSGSYFLNLEIIRAEALRAGIPYWTIVQSFEVELEHLRRRLPSESDLRMQVFSSLAYGFTGIMYFCYDHVFERGLTDPGGAPNRLYYAAQHVNTEIANVGQALRFLTSRHVLHVRGSHVENGRTVSHDAEAATRVVEPEVARDWSIRSVTIGEQAPGRDALLGLFEDYDGNRYFMLVNLWHSLAASPAQDKVTFTVELDTSITRITRLSRETGRPEVLSVPDSVLTLTLPGGTGDLFAVEEDTFPGLGRGRDSN